MANFDINAFYAKFAGNSPWDVPARIVRGNGVPLDTTSLFKDKSIAEQYAAGGSTLLSSTVDGKTLTYNPATSYPGQFIAVANATGVTGYLIGQDRKLIELGSASGTGDVADDLAALEARIFGGVAYPDDEDLSVDYGDGAIAALSVALSTDLSVEIINRTAAVQKLSSDLSGDIQALSTALSTDLSNEIKARQDAINDLSATVSAEIDADVGALSDALSSDIRSLSTALSTEISALNSKSDKAIQELSATVSAEIDADVGALSTALSTDLSSEIINRTAAVQKLSSDLSGDINALSTALSTEISAETEARKAAVKALEDKLSSAWHFVGEVTAEEVATPTGSYKNGDVVVVKEKDGETVVNTKEYAFDGEKFVELGADQAYMATKTQLETAIKELSATVSAEIDADVLSLSTALSTDLSNEITARTAAVQKLSSDLSGDINALSTALSTEISALNNKSDKAIQELSATVSAEIDADVGALSTALSTDLSNEITARTAAVQKLSSDLSGDIKALSVALSTDLSDEIEARKDNDTYLSTKIDQKIYAQVGDNATAVSVDTLTVHKISEEKYAELLNTEGGIVDTDIYIVSSENTNAYGHKVVNVADGTISSDAVNYKQLSAVSADLQTKIDEAVSDGIDELSAKVFNGSTSLSATLFDKIVKDVGDLSTALSTEIMNLDYTAQAATTGASVVSRVTQTDGKISVETRELTISALNDYSTVRTELTTDLSINVTCEKVNGDEILSTYTITQGGKSYTIDIPQDKVIESAAVVRGTLEGDTFTESTETDPKKDPASKYYIKATVANQTAPIYIPVPDLVDTYVGHDGTTIKTEIVSDSDGARCISAEVKEESIEMKHLTGIFVFDGGNVSAWADGTEIDPTPAS